jgi:hypothetical protein
LEAPTPLADSPKDEAVVSGDLLQTVLELLLHPPTQQTALGQELLGGEGRIFSRHHFAPLVTFVHACFRFIHNRRSNVSASLLLTSSSGSDA